VAFVALIHKHGSWVVFVEPEHAGATTGVEDGG
jgi:hypothetical protein